MQRRYISFLFAALLVFCSCSKNEPEVKYVTLTLTASIDTTAIETKTHMSIDGRVGKVQWSDGDKITLLNLEKVSSSARDFKNDRQSASFDFVLTEDELGYLKTSKVYFYYGSQTLTYSKLAYNAGKPQKISFGSIQMHAGDNVFNDGDNASFGYCPPNSITDQNTMSCVMFNVFGILKVNVELTDKTKFISSIRITDKASNYLAGTFSLSNIESHNPTLTYDQGSGGQSFTIEKKVLGDVHGGDFYFLVPPGSLCTDAGFDIAVYTKDGMYGGKTIKNLQGKTSIERSMVTPITLTTFKPKDIPVQLQPTANSYIVSSSPGTRSIPAEYKGNGYQGNGADIAAGSNLISNAVSAEIIWQGRLTGDPLMETEVISNATYFLKNGHAYIGFNTTGIEGNALVAVKDVSGTILWSWHIWATESTDVTAIQAGVMLVNQQNPTLNVVNIMDRNLGALSADPAAGSQFHGLAYQYGRKDPYMGSRFSVDPTYVITEYESFATIAPATAISCVTNSAITLDYSVQHPYHRSFPSTVNWCTSDVYWGSPSGDQSQSSPKTLYDPCPAGWRTFEEINLAMVLGRDSTKKIARPLGEVVNSDSGLAFKLDNNNNPVYFPGSGYSSSTLQVSSVGKIVSIWGANFYSSGTAATHSQAHYLSIELKKIGSGIDSYSSDTPVGDMRNTMPVRCQKWTEPPLPQ